MSLKHFDRVFEKDLRSTLGCCCLVVVVPSFVFILICLGQSFFFGFFEIFFYTKKGKLFFFWRYIFSRFNFGDSKEKLWIVFKKEKIVELPLSFNTHLQKSFFYLKISCRSKMLCVSFVLVEDLDLYSCILTCVA